MVYALNTYTFPGFNKCIYCGSTHDLTDEHIIPLSLGGKHVLSKASCLSCAKQTSRLERRIAKDLWGEARAAYNAPSRRKRKAKKYLDMDGLKVRTEDFPGMFVFYEMPIPGILAGMDEDVDTTNLWRLRAHGNMHRANEMYKKFPGRVKLKFTHLPKQFGQLLIKIGYCQTLTTISPDDLSQSYTSYIFNENANVSFLVGCTSSPPDIPKNVGSFLGNYMVGDLNKSLIVAQVQIFSELASPVYDVVVGTVEGRENIKSLLPKIGMSDTGRRLLLGP